MKTNNNLPAAKELLQKYLEHKCTPEEEEQVLRWYFSFNTEDDLPDAESERERILRLAKQNILTATTDKKGSSPGNHSRSSWLKSNLLQHTWIKIAAVLVIMCSTAIFFVQRSDHAASPVLEFRTLAAQRKTITLTDGTRIWLNNSSVLTYPAKFGAKTREVELDGEAFFEVAHNTKRPFLVHMRQLKVQVLGTSFNVRAYERDKDIAVHVATGKVAVISNKYKVMLIRGEGVTYDPEHQNFSVSPDDTALSRAWQNNTLYFRYQTLETISQRLERWYGVKFDIRNDQLKQRKYTLEQHNETLENVMKVLSAGEFNYKITKGFVKVW